MAVGWFKVKGIKYLAKGNGALVKSTKYSDGLKTYKFDSYGRKK